MNPAEPIDELRAEELLVDGDSLIYEFELDAPLDKVWHALTDPALVARWMLPEPTEPDAQVELHLATRRPPHYVAYYWRAEDEPESLVSFELRTGADGGTHLRLTQQRALRLPNQWAGPVAMLQAA
jgi:uncharacterized protein YndB with AHSA1/START domain